MNFFEALVAAGPNEIVDALADYLTPPAWHAEAACRGMGPERFYPERGRDPTDARAVCDRCPVTAECLEHALEHEGHGIWAGTSPATRRSIRQNRKRESS